MNSQIFDKIKFLNNTATDTFMYLLLTVKKSN